MKKLLVEAVQYLSPKNVGVVLALVRALLTEEIEQLNKQPTTKRE